MLSNTFVVGFGECHRQRLVSDLVRGALPRFIAQGFTHLCVEKIRGTDVIAAVK